MATTRSTSRTRTSAKRSTGSSTNSRAKSSTSTRTRSTAHKSRGKTAHSSNPSSTGHGRAKKQPAKQTSRCWPGYEPVPGKSRNEKGSCKPKAHQTSAEKKSDGMAAAANKLRKAGGSKRRANHSR